MTMANNNNRNRQQAAAAKLQASYMDAQGENTPSTEASTTEPAPVQASTPEAAPTQPDTETTDTDLSYVDEFHAINGRRGFEFLDDIQLTGDRATDKALVVSALEQAARTGNIPTTEASTERGFIAAPDEDDE